MRRCVYLFSSAYACRSLHSRYLLGSGNFQRAVICLLSNWRRPISILFYTGLKRLLPPANGPASDEESARESVKLGVRGHEIEIPHFSVASSVAFPRELFRFSYTYRRPDKPISSVTIDLGDYSRRVSVTGQTAEQVEAISKVLEKDLFRFSTTIGGATFRRVAGVCLSVAFLTFLGLSSAWWWHTRASSALGMLICSTVGLLLVLLAPWDRYLPGFALYQSYSPFLLIRYAPQIFFLILVAALLGIPLSYFLPRLGRRA